MAEFSIVVISQNEESNIGHCIGAAVRFSDDVWVVDSYSTDRTREIVRELGAGIVEHEFESWGAQRNDALDSLSLKHDFVLFLDADEQIDKKFSDELSAAVEAGGYAAFNVNFDIVFMGRVLKHSHENPPVLRVVRKGTAKWLSEGAREYCVVQGTVGRIRARIRHEDRKGIFFWLAKHIRNAHREAHTLVKKEDIDLRSIGASEKFERPGRLWLRKLYNKLPRIIRPFLFFSYRYFVRLGFLDGYPGFVFCFLQAFWYNLIIDVRVYEMKLGHDNYLPTYEGRKTVSRDDRPV